MTGNRNVDFSSEIASMSQARIYLSNLCSRLDDEGDGSSAGEDVA